VSSAFNVCADVSPHSADTARCELCDRIIYYVKRGTRILLENLFESNLALIEGSDVAAIGLGRMTVARARRCLRDRHTVSLTTLMAADFPGLLETFHPKMRQRAEICAPIMGEGGNTLYVMLSLLYRDTFIDRSTSGRRRLGTMSIVRFILLCFHLSHAYLLTSDSVFQMWSGALRIDAITTLFGPACSETKG
jgi:hypothetical protein